MSRVMTLVCLSSLMLVLMPVPSAAENVPSALSFHGCETQFGGFPTTVDIARSLAPPGFEPAPFSFDATGATGSWAIYVQRCAFAENDGILTGAVQQAWLLLRVAPPAEWADPSVTAYFVVLGGVTDDAFVSDTYAAWGVTTDGTATIDALALGAAPASPGQVASVSGDDVAYQFVNAPTVGGSPWGPFTMRLFGVDGDGHVHAADHTESVGRISQIQPTAVTLADGGGPLAGGHTGLGRSFSWASGGPSWVVAPVAT